MGIPFPLVGTLDTRRFEWIGTKMVVPRVSKTGSYVSVPLPSGEYRIVRRVRTSRGRGNPGNDVRRQGDVVYEVVWRYRKAELRFQMTPTGFE